ncbi:MAG: ArsC family reductase [Methylophilaceae bacterium]|jgi:arsenate reductase
MKLYGIPNCNTVKKARAWLDEHSVEYDFHDYKKLGVDRAMLESWLEQMPWEKLVNRAGTTWRGLGDAEKAAVVDNTSAAALMIAKPSVIRRPVIVDDARILAIGFDSETYTSLF